ncbi:unnamed protein product [Acanthoscelides obtectus]|uniref:Uncharacterized protein n=1 Tax=Acanthoscelides obtectus TaxID=200917 RepID=A0A9P0JKR2_ACAOB|nr:unnamed protein product [Acanthoscelides obtectus]CAK1662079.1 hypothetical protein AOBTE_LOCUS22968 [Acanthoscelides obtectus]
MTMIEQSKSKCNEPKPEDNGFLYPNTHFGTRHDHTRCFPGSEWWRY